MAPETPASRGPLDNRRVRQLKRLLDLEFISHEEYYNYEAIERQLRRRELRDEFRQYLARHYVVVSSEHYKKRRSRVARVRYRYNPDTLHTQPVYKLFNLEIDVEFEDGERELVKGYLELDHANELLEVESIRAKAAAVRARLDDMDMEEEFRAKYLTVLRKNLLISMSAEDIVNMVVRDYQKLQGLRAQLTSKLVKTFIVHDVVERYEIINLLIIMSNDRDIGNAKLLYKFTMDVKDRRSEDLMDYLTYDQQRRMEMIIKREAGPAPARELTFEERLQLVPCDRVRRVVETRLKEYNKGKGVTESSSKAEKYLNGFFSIPFGTNVNDPIFDEMRQFRERVGIKMKKYERRNFAETLAAHPHFAAERAEFAAIRDRQRAFIARMEGIMDASVFGHERTKHHVKRLIGQMLNGNQRGNIIGLKGPPGIGKTSLVREGVSKVLGREFSMITLGGVGDGSYLAGHNYTYLGSHWGRLVEILMETKCMNPIIYIDELDKVSKTPNGEEIIGILTHATDMSQNSEFFDKYFSGVPIDLSNVIFIFSYNDESAIDKILLDRINQIEMDFLTADEKKVVLQRYTIPKSLRTLCSPVDICVPEWLVEYVIHEYSRDGGMRGLNKLVDMLLQDVNLRMIQAAGGEARYELTREDVDRVFRDRRPHIDAINPVPRQVGVVHGLFATSYGYGGVLQVQAVALGEGDKCEVSGSAGTVMLESVRCVHVLLRARFGAKISFHVNITNTGQPKDGPSAGLALFLALHSCLSGRTLPHTLACTGEVDILGNVYKIGGLKEKLYGGYRAGARTFLVPRANFDRLAEEFAAACPEPVRVEPVDSVDDALRLLDSL